ncbi:hypothetical protein COCSADRAFT_192184 [Bipolaris sorokiniana ND90Pr]|uniref:RING-type domain-containing protein n=1 Tax=Cochliobolus sativus (strain ND90Pr / ATCC 201652) TaxID=665912 RepID=M2R4S4_COCSN|nr:uncharacterized protein COCSADRAFT_192184 [Bipolaris sorokiniana ND90Pr]EMD62149.1 hypothetical protein COCSADRAFT_192184 [Bipolaris sorokiniana ND90Pr]
MAPKRRAEIVDLTADDAPDSSSYRAPKQSRTSKMKPHRKPSPDAIQGHSQEHYNYLLYGALDDNILGVRYYNGYATEGETVVLRREPQNQYDANAIRVDNEKYNVLEAEAKGQLDKYRKSISKKDAASTYRHLLQVLLRLRQTKTNSPSKNSSNSPSTPKKTASICLDMYKDRLITTCAHTFCTPCLERIIESSHKCPLCRSPLSSLATTTVKPAKKNPPHLPSAPSAPSTQEELADKTSLEISTSTKIEALLSILHASRKNPTTKTIIFSQWPLSSSPSSPHTSTPIPTPSSA